MKPSAIQKITHGILPHLPHRNDGIVFVASGYHYCFRGTASPLPPPLSSHLLKVSIPAGDADAVTLDEIVAFVTK